MRRAAIAFLLLLFCAAAAAQVEMEEIGALQESYASAFQAYQAVKFPRAIEILNPLLDTLTQWEQAGRLQPSDEALLERALELRGACAFNLGKTDLARQDWTRLIQLRPEYPFTVAKSAKILKLFEDIRSSQTGLLALAIEPPDSVVTIDGRPLGATSGTVPVLRGVHLIKVTRPGYAPGSEELTVDTGTTFQVTVKLVPNARTIYFMVQPEGAQLLMDGKPIGRADRPASAQEDWAKFVRESGADPSAVFVIAAPHLPPGDHRVALVCPCHRKREFVMTVVLDRVGNTPGFVKPIVLERRTVSLEVTSHPSGSQVSIDGRLAGTTPLHLSDFCIGTHDLLVQKAGIGLYRSALNVTEMPVFRVEVSLRPTLLWVGLTRDQEASIRQTESAGEAIVAALPEMAHFNAQTADEKNPVLADTFFTPGVGAQDQAAVVKDLCEKYRCQGLLAGKLTAESGHLSLALRLFVPEFGGYDESQAVLKDAVDAPQALALVDRPLVDRSGDLHFTLFDGPGGKGPLFARGAADPAGPVAGDVLLAVGGTSVQTAAAARTALAAADSPALKFLHKGEEKTWSPKPWSRVELVPYGGDGYGYRLQWLKARQGVASSETPQEQLVARLSLAYAELNLGRPVEALAALEPLDGPFLETLNGNTVGYLRAVALVQLGRPEEARSPLKAASTDPAASLDGLGAVLVQPLAEDLLRQLPPPPPVVPAGAGKREK